MGRGTWGRSSRLKPTTSQTSSSAGTMDCCRARCQPQRTLFVPAVAPPRWWPSISSCVRAPGEGGATESRIRGSPLRELPMMMTLALGAPSEHLGRLDPLPGEVVGRDPAGDDRLRVLDPLGLDHLALGLLAVALDLELHPLAFLLHDELAVDPVGDGRRELDRPDQDVRDAEDLRRRVEVVPPDRLAERGVEPGQHRLGELLALGAINILIAEAGDRLADRGADPGADQAVLIVVAEVPVNPRRGPRG